MPDRDALQTRVNKIIIDDDTDTLDRVVPEIQKAQREIEDLSYMFVAQEATIGTDPPSIAGDQGLVAVPSNWIAPRGRPFRLVGGSGDDNLDLVTPPLEWMSPGEEVLKLYPADPSNTSARGKPRFLTYDENETKQIRIYPVPDIVYTHRILYWKRLVTLSSGSTTNWWTDNAEDFLVWQAAGRVLDFNEQFERSIKYEIRARSERDRMKNQDKRRRYRRNSTGIRPRRDVHASVKQGRM